MAGGLGLLRPLAGSSALHPSDLPTACLLPLAFLAPLLSAPLSPHHRNLAVVSLGLLLSSLLSLLTDWSSPRLSLPHLGSAGLTLLLLPPDSRAAAYTVYWAVICLQPAVRHLVTRAPRSFTFGEASVVCQAVLLLAASLVLQLVALPAWTPLAAVLAVEAEARATLTSLRPQAATVVALLGLWSLLGLLSLGLVPLYAARGWPVTTSTRKLFHLAVLLVFTSGLAACPLLLLLASVGAALGLVGLELVRVSRLVPRLSDHLTSALGPFLDSKDGGPLILTHIYLLVGVSWPLWLWPGQLPGPPAPLALHAGLLSVGVLDSVASVAGSALGRRRWTPGSGRTLEGSLAGWAAAMAYLYCMETWGLVAVPAWGPAAAALAAVALAEAAMGQVDNLVLPLFTYGLLALL